MNKFPMLKIGDLWVSRPVVQGGMGVGISLSSLAGNVAKEGAIGLISSAQIGFREPDFHKMPFQANLRAIESELKKAREIASKAVDKMGAIGFNIMVATKGYEEYVKTAVRHGADLIVSGAGLPIDLPRLIQEGMELRKAMSPDRIFGEIMKVTKFAPIVSTIKSAEVILKFWDRKEQTTADMVVVEGPLAGGHLGFSAEELSKYGADTADTEKTYRRDLYDEEVKGIIEVVKKYGKKYGKKIPVILAGGIFEREDVVHAFDIGADGVQVGTRFVTTRECDAPNSYKQAYIHATKEDVKITKSPVGMPGRAIENPFLAKVKSQKKQIANCWNCLSKCDRKTIPYCITEELLEAVDGDLNEALIFSGAKSYKCDGIETVSQVLTDLCG